MTAPEVVVVAVGSPYRRDDGAGRAVADTVRELLGRGGPPVQVADPLELLGIWDGAQVAVVADAMRSGAPPGTVEIVDLDAVPDSTAAGGSTHSVGLARTLRLARRLGGAPSTVLVVAIEGADFGSGEGLSEPVATAVPEAARLVVAALRGLR
ncbi:MAG TPA: hydrogenase maturation protease [Acidimicrobiales bacterium]|nr:hydrogenase maturation protease [Acidimicrobiales bacterium]